ncbi:MAG TPA: IS4 family transposase [Thermoanaerobaculia bacterium]|nr:IS4 family transposase [Thermoanaerobaculia bacterium]
MPAIRAALADLGGVVVRPVNSRDAEESRIWRSLLDQHHYLGSGPLCGAQIRYLIESAAYGIVGAMAFSSASWVLADRDRYIGWTPAGRIANLQKVVCNARLLIAPSVQVPNLASHSLALALARLPADWDARYGVRPVLVETFVDPSRFAGTCYRAANWIEAGRTAGRRDGVAKQIFLRPLVPDWRSMLCEAEPVPLGKMVRPETPANWAEEEFGTVRFYDERLKQRLYRLAQDFYASPQAGIPEACGSKARTMGAYRFFQNQAVNMDVILTPHLEAAIERIKEHPVVLAPQDTTTLDYSTHPMTGGLGPTNGVQDHSIGLILHDTLAFTEDGTPLGVLDAQCWARDPADRGKSQRRHETPVEQKESMKWLRSFRKVAEVQRLCPGTMLVSIGDRESDLYELFLEAAQDPQGPKLLARSNRRRQRRVVEEEAYLWDFMASCELSATLKLHLPRSGARRARDASVDLRYARVSLRPPKRSASDPPVPLWAVYLQEETDAEDLPDPIEWLLLTTAPVESAEDAQKTVEWYSGRWGIEVYHRTLKSGCRIRDRQLGSADRLESCLGIDMVVAWRIYHLAMLGRETPEVPCTVFFNDVEWKTLCCFATKNPAPPETPPTMAGAVRMVGQIGGHLGRKSDGPPGTQVLWRGLQRLEVAVETVELFGFFPAQPPRALSP